MTSIDKDALQPTCIGSPLPLANLRKREAGFWPVLKWAAEVDRFVLSLVDGRSTPGEIARRTLEEFPRRFAAFSKALGHVGDLSVRNSQ
jgi:hypothetical protein